MEVDSGNPSEINSFRINEEHRTNSIDLNKKRKLQAEQLGLPISKHKSWNRSLLSKNIIKGISEEGAVDDGSEDESAKGSNSFAEDYDSAISVHGDSKFEEQNGKTCQKNTASSSSHWGSSSVEDSYSMDSTMVTGDGATFLGEEHHHSHHVDKVPVGKNPDEALIEYGSHADYLHAEYGEDIVEQCGTFKEVDDIPYSNEANPNSYVLSSGRWSVHQETEQLQAKRKPTIDQEFEQYFSSLML